MSETNERAGELIGKYLDGVASEEEVAELSRMLVESQEFAREFARMTRQDAHLQQRFAEQRAAADVEPVRVPVTTAVRRVSRMNLILSMAAAFLVGVGVFWLVQFGKGIGIVPTVRPVRIAEGAMGPSPVAVPGDEVLAKIVKIAGNVKWRIDGARCGTLRNGDPVLKGMKIETVAGGRVKLEYLGEATSLDVTDESSFRVQGSGTGGKQVAFGRGKLAAVVAKQAEGKPFVVVTPQAEAEVMGTAFDMLVDRVSSEVAVYDGTIRYSRLADGKKLDVRAGQGVVAGEGKDFVIMRCRYLQGDQYRDSAVLFQDDLTAGIDNWSVVVSTNGRTFRQATAEEIARIVRKVQPDDGWQQPDKAKGVVLVPAKGETVGLSLRTAIPRVPVSVEFVRQAGSGSTSAVAFGDVLEEEVVRELPHNQYEPGSSYVPRYEAIPVAVRGNARIVEQRYFIWGRPARITRLTTTKYDGLPIIITFCGDGRRAVFTDVAIREMKKVEPSK